MKILVLIAVVLLFAGCATTEPAIVSPDQPELVSMVPLPPFISTYPLGGLHLGMLLHVMDDGKVSEVRLLSTSGNAAWDSGAVQSIKQWRYTAPKREGKPFATWFRQVVAVQFQEPVIRVLGELVVARKEDGDSLYKLIQAGIDFETLAKQSTLSLQGHCGFLGSVNLATFPKRIRDEVEALKVNDITKPIRVGDRYILYKRFKSNDPPGPAE